MTRQASIQPTPTFTATPAEPERRQSGWFEAGRLSAFCGLMVALAACDVTVSEGPIGNGGSFSFAGTAGDGTGGAEAGSAGMGGSGLAGAAGSSMGGMAGSMSFMDPDAGMGPALLDPPPSCTADAADDDCISCLKQQCCDQWLACDDTGCAQEWADTRSCVEALEFPDSQEYAACVSSSALQDMLPQANTAELLTCISEEAPLDAGPALTRCGEVCYGVDIVQ